MSTRKLQLSVMLCISFICVSVMSAAVPAVLPQPDQNPPSGGKVKVYILAGQSNMVGFGTLKGARPCFSSIFLSADPGIKAGRMPIGPAALLPHGVYEATASVYAGSYKEGADYGSMKPVKEGAVALGTVAQQLPSVKGDHTVVVKAFIDVPMTGTHEIHPGMGDSTYAVATLEGKEVYRKDPGKDAVVTPVTLEQGKRYPLTITYIKSGSAALWLQHTELKGVGDLTSLTQQGKFPWFIDKDGKWTVRNDVTYWETRCTKEEGGSGGPLTTSSNYGGKFIGPEVPFGYVMGAYHDEPVLLIESSMGNRALSFDFRPPSSGKTEEEKTNKYCGYEYDAMVKGVHDTLKKIDKIVPGYKGQGYEIVGFVWWQGHKDSNVPKEIYEKHLVNLIQDLRQEFKAPDLKAVVATVGFGGMEMPESHFMTWEAQMAVGDPKQHPEFQGNVASVDTRSFWRSKGESPTGTGYHYNHNAETYVLTGDALGRAMVRLLGGKAEDIKLPAKEARDPNVEKIFSDEVTGVYNKKGPHYSPEYIAEMGDALKPIVMDAMVPGFLESSFTRGGTIKDITVGKKPARTGTDIQGPLDALIGYYNVAGTSEYDWKPFGPEMRTAKWSYFSFDPPEKQDLAQSDRFRKITFPKGMENWHTADFSPKKAGWKVGQAPFGRMGDKLDRRRPGCNGPLCGCSKMPATLWEKEVLLMSQTFDIPAVKEGHAYRFILGGSGCDRSGEGFAIYANGKLITEVKGGLYRYSGIRGAYLYPEMLSDFKGGKVTISIISFLRHTHFKNGITYFGPHPDYRGTSPVPPNGHVTLWMEEAKLSPEVLKEAEKFKGNSK